MFKEVIEEKILLSIEALWKSVLEIRDFSGKFTFFQSILLPSEYNEAISGRAQNMVTHISREKFDHMTIVLSSTIETVRPFVGESIWALYSTYRAIAMRQALKINDGLQKGKLHEWDKDFQGQPDNLLRQLLKTVFSEDELSRIIPNNHLGATASIISALEFKLLSEINEWVFNRRYRPLDLDKHTTIQNLITVRGDMYVGGDIVGESKTTIN